MDLNKIFNIFSNNIEPEDEETSLLIDFSSHPLYWIGGFNKILNNKKFFKEYTKHIFDNLKSELNLEDIEKAGEYLMFEKAWGYIKNIDINNSFHIECIKEKYSDEFINNLKVAITFFESKEEYEKCGLLFNILEKLKNFQS